MKIGIIVNAYIRNPSQIKQAERLKEELARKGARAEIIKNCGLADIKNNKIAADISPLCVFFDKDRAAARLLEASGVKLVNCAEAIETCDDKMLTHIALACAGLPQPDCVYAPLCYYDDAAAGKEFFDRVAKLGFPLVAKKCFGSLGDGVTLIKTRAELEKYEGENKLFAHFYQKFIGKGGEDIRVIVVGGKFVCAMKRSNPDDFRSNVGKGGKGENYDADGSIIWLAERVAEVLSLDYCGIDILRGNDGGYYVCEVNSNAFFEEAEKVCGVNIAERLAEQVLTYSE